MNIAEHRLNIFIKRLGSFKNDDCTADQFSISGNFIYRGADKLAPMKKVIPHIPYKSEKIQLIRFLMPFWILIPLHSITISNPLL